MPDLRPTIALRLTLWYAGAFALSSLLALMLVYGITAAVLRARTDAELRQDVEEITTLTARGGLAGFREELARERAGPDSASVFLRLWSTPGGEPLESIGFGPPTDLVHRQFAAASAGAADAEPQFRTDRQDDLDHGVRVAFARAGPEYLIEFGQSLEELDEILGALAGAMALALPIVLLLGGPIGWLLARRALGGVEQLRRTALEIADGALDRRVPVGRYDDELDRLAVAFNTMLDRIERLVGGMRDVTDNLAHDMRTPLARIRASAERALGRGEPPGEDAGFAATTIEECDRVLHILDGTLEIAEASAGAAPLALAEIDVAQLAEEARDLFATLAEDSGVELVIEAGSPCIVRADRSRVQRIVANLIDNAIKYTPTGGRITLVVVDEPQAARIEVRDTGSGIAAEDLPRIFERFYRGDGSRGSPGSGLGLSLARAFARAHGGDLTAASAPGQGSRFILRLPRRGG